MKKNFLAFAAFALFLLSCNNSDETHPSENLPDSMIIDEVVTVPPVDQTFPELYRYLSSSGNDFSNAEFEGGETEMKTDTTVHQIEPRMLDPFREYLIYNADSSYAIDPVTYNYIPVKQRGKTVLAAGGPDFELGLINLKNNTRRQLLFFGTMGTVLDAKWQDANTVMIAGAREISGDSLRPVIWRYDVPADTWHMYTYKEMISADGHAYPKRWEVRKD